MSTRTVHQLTRTRRAPFRKIGCTRCCVFVPEEIDAFLNGAELEVTELPRGGVCVKPKGAS